MNELIIVEIFDINGNSLVNKGFNVNCWSSTETVLGIVGMKILGY